ncbi:hypothetical protein [Brevibacillus choshinensis]|uniref:hypothetical protein n=1 Tax=Brevibacillus choshinensis TaxID=54911 RepID=UPI002E1C5472|nr:hypothetical protein [Brevibacillus choshinensis]
MSENFFGHYKEFVVVPKEEKEEGMEEVFVPEDYASHYILTFSLYDSCISSWKEADKFHVNAENSLKKVVAQLNAKKKSLVRLELLEIDDEITYFVLALSWKEGNNNEQNMRGRIQVFLEKDFSTDLLIGETWYQLIGAKGKFERRLFTYTMEKYEPRSAGSYED